MKNRNDSFKGKEFILAIDQWINTWFNGYADSSISGRSYFLSALKVQDPGFKNRKYWTRLRKIIDWGFTVVDRPDHCKDSYESDPGEIYSDLKGPIARGILLVIVTLFCIPLGVISRCVQKLKSLFS